MPTPLDDATRQRMRRQPRRDTAPELALRRAAHATGLRYTVDAPLPLPGLRRRADMLFPRARVAVFLDGAFWHACPEHGTLPRNNADWWAEKLRRNVERDRHTDQALAEVGWLAFRVCERDDPAIAARELHQIVTERSRSLP